MLRLLLLGLLVSAFLLVSVSSTVVPFASCSQKGAHVQVFNVNSDNWPPSAGENLNISVNATVLDETVTSGIYTIAITLDGFPLPDITGDIDTFHPLPWNKGPLIFNFEQDVPGSAPPGVYKITISAVDQNNQQLFCLAIQFTITVKENQNPAIVAKQAILNRINARKSRHHVKQVAAN